MKIKKYGAIDIGSNAVRLLIANVIEEKGKDPKFKKSSLVRVPIRLGADAFVAAAGSGQEQYSEYQFSIDHLDQSTPFAINIVMSSTNESAPVKLKDFRAIALA